MELTRPRWAVYLGWAAFVVALFAVALSAFWQGVPFWMFALGAALSLVTFAVVQTRQQAWLGAHRLYFEDTPSARSGPPNGFLGTFSKKLGQPDLTPVTLLQSWSHLFGLTLSLKLPTLSAHKPKVIVLTLWRNRLSAQGYRRLRVWAAWQSEHQSPLFKG
ncbi:MAG: hypothetical protein CK528_07545 [Alcaligenaceae bacterium]|nr:MAG: hypothetical protein CK528_07545 [Alcaligenaceae bacterium]